MGKPITPLVGADVFITNQNQEVLLIQRADNSMWALPGGCHDLGETPAQCAIRECKEETGYDIKLTRLLGTWSSNCYDYVHYPWKENEFCHLLFDAEITGGTAKTSHESLKIEWFKQTELPLLSDGHEIRIDFAFKALGKQVDAYFE